MKISRFVMLIRKGIGFRYCNLLFPGIKFRKKKASESKQPNRSRKHLYQCKLSCSMRMPGSIKWMRVGYNLAAKLVSMPKQRNAAIVPEKQEQQQIPYD